MRTEVKDAGDLRRYRTEIPNLVDDSGLSVYAFRLYVHLKRVAGDSGVCYQGTRTLAKACKMSIGKVSDAKVELTKNRLIFISPSEGDSADHITIADIWQENMETYFHGEGVHHMNTCSPHEHRRSPDEQGCSPHEQKKERTEEETHEEIKDRGLRGEKRRASPSLPDDDYLDSLQAKPAYTKLDVRHVYAKMSVWCEAKGKQPTRMRLINWLNREDQPMSAATERNGNGTNGNRGKSDAKRADGKPTGQVTSDSTTGGNWQAKHHIR